MHLMLVIAHKNIQMNVCIFFYLVLFHYKMVNPWITWVRSEALRLDISYGCALSLREVRLGYQKKKLEERIAAREKKKREEERRQERIREGEKKVDDAIRKAVEKAREKAETKRLLDTKLVPKK